MIRIVMMTKIAYALVLLLDGGGDDVFLVIQEIKEELIRK